MGQLQLKIEGVWETISSNNQIYLNLLVPSLRGKLFIISKILITDTVKLKAK